MKLNNRSLSKRELEVLKYFCQGWTCREIAKDLCLSYETIRSHRKNLFLKLNVRTGCEMGAVGIKLFAEQPLYQHKIA